MPSSQNVYGYNTPFWLKLVAPVQLCGSFALPPALAKEEEGGRTEPARENAPCTFVYMYIVINGMRPNLSQVWLRHLCLHASAMTWGGGGLVEAPPFTFSRICQNKTKLNKNTH